MVLPRWLKRNDLEHVVNSKIAPVGGRDANHGRAVVAACQQRFQQALSAEAVRLHPGQKQGTGVESGLHWPAFLRAPPLAAELQSLGDGKRALEALWVGNPVREFSQHLGRQRHRARPAENLALEELPAGAVCGVLANGQTDKKAGIESVHDPEFRISSSRSSPAPMAAGRGRATVAGCPRGRRPAAGARAGIAPSLPGSARTWAGQGAKRPAGNPHIMASDTFIVMVFIHEF